MQNEFVSFPNCIVHTRKINDCYSSCDDTISYLEDVDSDTGECYADPEPLTCPQPYMHEPEAEAVSVRVEDRFNKI